jgi:hypothetical protein
MGLPALVQNGNARYLKGLVPGAADCLRGLAGLGLDDETTQLFLHGNAERVFGLAPVAA